MSKSLENILVSVVMPAYNAEKTIAKSIESVLRQTHQDFELIIVDDASTDNTPEIACEYGKSDLRVRVLRHSENSGVAIARNHGIEQAHGKYVALLDSDDLWEPDKLERQIALAIRKNADIIYCSYDFIDKDGAPIKRPFIVPLHTSFKSMLINNVIGNSTALIDTQLLKKNPFDPALYHEDYALWMKLLSTPVTAIGDPKVLMHYRQVRGSRNEKKLRAAKERWRIYRDYLHLKPLKCSVVFTAYAVNGVKKYFF